MTSETTSGNMIRLFGKKERTVKDMPYGIKNYIQYKCMVSCETDKDLEIITNLYILEFQRWLKAISEEFPIENDIHKKNFFTYSAYLLRLKQFLDITTIQSF